MNERAIIVLDFGSQFTQLIARRLRELKIYSEVYPYTTSIEKLKKLKPYGFILSGGPYSVYEKNSPQYDIKSLLNEAPVLGICYGMQLLCQNLGGKVRQAEVKEYGLNTVSWEKTFGNYPSKQRVWMSHGDIVESAPEGMTVVGRSQAGHPAALRGDKVWAVQFHPEVIHTESGDEVLRAFTVDLCHAPQTWSAGRFEKMMEDEILASVPKNENVLCALSGGVDSTVVGTLLTKTLGKNRVHCVFVDTGMLRKHEFEDVLKVYGELGLNVEGVRAEEEFLSVLKGIDDPEKKRKAIGQKFIEIFERFMKTHKDIKWLAQGTLYPDRIESLSMGGPSATIKSHHNVGGLPEKMNLKLIEPLKNLFKDEVRALGAELGISHQLLWRHPFPGPGLAIRVMGAIDKESLDVLRECDAVFIRELQKHNLYEKIWQAFCVLLPTRSVGVQGDARSYERVLVLRAVTSVDGMTADWYKFDSKFLEHVSNCITNEVKKIGRVLLDITSKPPATIEWE